MAVTVDEVIVSLEAKLGQYNANIERAERNFTKAMASMERGSHSSANAIQAHFAQMGHHVGRSIAALAGIEGLRRLGEGVIRAVENADRLKSLSELLDITTDSLQALQQQADEFGSSADELNQGLTYFTRQIGLAAAGNGNLLKILEANNVALRDSKGAIRAPIDLLKDYADLIKNAADQNARLVLTAEGFGRGSSELANTFAGGSKAVTDFYDKVTTTGRIIDKEVIDRLAEMKPLMDEIANKWKVAWNNAIISSDGFFDKVFKKSAELQRYLESLPGSKAGHNEVIDRDLSSAQRLKAFANLPLEGNDDALAAAMKRRLSIAAAKKLGTFGGKDELGPDTGKKTIIPDFSPPPDTGKRWKEVTKAIEADTAVLQRQAEQVGKTRLEQEKAVAVQQLTNDAIRVGIEVTPALTKQIEALATAHAQAVVHLEELERAEDRATDRIDAFKDASKDIFGSFFEDIRHGTSLTDSFNNALSRLGDKLAELATNVLFNAIFGQSGLPGAQRGGLIGSLLGPLLGGSASVNMPSGRASSVQQISGGGSGLVHVVASVKPSPLLITEWNHKAKGAEDRAIARGPAVARNESRRYAVP